MIGERPTVSLTSCNGPGFRQAHGDGGAPAVPSGLVPPTSGEVVHVGEPVRATPRRVAGTRCATPRSGRRSPPGRARRCHRCASWTSWCTREALARQAEATNVVVTNRGAFSRVVANAGVLHGDRPALRSSELEPFLVGDGLGDGHPVPQPVAVPVPRATAPSRRALRAPSCLESVNIVATIQACDPLKRSGSLRICRRPNGAWPRRRRHPRTE